MTSRDPRMCCEAVRLAILAAAWLLVDFALILTEVQVITQLLAEIRLLGFSSHRILRSLPKDAYWVAAVRAEPINQTAASQQSVHSVRTWTFLHHRRHRELSRRLSNPSGLGHHGFVRQKVRPRIVVGRGTAGCWLLETGYFVVCWSTGYSTRSLMSAICIQNFRKDGKTYRSWM